jgi:hypothetical protein
MLTLEGERSKFNTRQPAVLVAACFAAGIVLDRFVLNWSWGLWCFASLLALAFAAQASWRAQPKMLVMGLLALGIALGGLRHHAFWSLSTTKEISRFVTLESRLVNLQGVIAEPPYVKLPSQAPFRSALPQSPMTIFPLKCESLWDRNQFVPVDGKLQVRVVGLLPKLKVSDAVEITGWISLP